MIGRLNDNESVAALHANYLTGVLFGCIIDMWHNNRNGMSGADSKESRHSA